MKHLHSRVWGWEMPWWGHDDTDGGDPARHARIAGAAFGRAFFATLEALEETPPQTPEQTPEAAPSLSAGEETAELPAVPCWSVHEFVLSGPARVENPFMDASLVGEMTAPSGRRLMVEGFHDPDDSAGGHERWRLRFAPDEVGVWHYRLRGEGVTLYREGRLVCIAPERWGPAGASGPIGVDPQNAYTFAHADGRPFFGVGDTCYGLVSGISDAQRRRYLDTRAAQRFNFVRFYASGYPWQIHPSLDGADGWPWGGTPNAPDYDRLNPRFFRRLDGLLEELRSRHLRAEILVFNLYLLSRSHGAHNPWGTVARERLWVRALQARFASSPAVFLWTVANEFECYPDGQYRFDPADVRWARRMGTLLHDGDPFHHPTTVHPTGIAGGGLLRAQGPLFGEGPEIDVLTHQHNSYDTASWVDTPAPGYWDGAGVGIDTALRADRRYDKPVVNTEFGYEWLAGYPNSFNRQLHGTDKCRRTAWRILVAGGAALAAGFAGTWHGRDGSFRDLPAPFVVADQGAARQLGHLADFVATLPLGRLQPFDGVRTVRVETAEDPGGAGSEALALADPGQTYVLYLPNGGDVTVDLSDAAGALAAHWLNPRSGASGPTFAVSGTRSRDNPCRLTAPDGEDWVLLIRAV